MFKTDGKTSSTVFIEKRHANVYTLDFNDLHLNDVKYLVAGERM